MTIKVRWDNDAKTVYYWEYEPGWTWDDFEHAHSLATKLLSTITYDVAAILNYQRTNPPPDRSVLDEWTKRGVLAFQHLRTIVVVDATPAVLAFNHYYERILVRSNRTILYADTVEEARALLTDRYR